MGYELQLCQKKCHILVTIGDCGGTEGGLLMGTHSEGSNLM